VHGDWKYLSRAIDRDGVLVDVMFSEHRKLAAAKRFFRSAKTVTGAIPDRVTTDGHDAYSRAIRTELGSRVRHRTSRYLNNRLEQDHRGIKGRCRPMLGFKSVPSARRFCRSHVELWNFLRSRSHMCQHVPAATPTFSTCDGQPLLSVSWKLLDREILQPSIAPRTGSKADRTVISLCCPECNSQHKRAVATERPGLLLDFMISSATSCCLALWPRVVSQEFRMPSAKIDQIIHAVRKLRGCRQEAKLPAQSGIINVNLGEKRLLAVGTNAGRRDYGCQGQDNSGHRDDQFQRSSFLHGRLLPLGNAYSRRSENSVSFHH
jgi:hypothetical protein